MLRKCFRFLLMASVMYTVAQMPAQKWQAISADCISNPSVQEISTIAEHSESIVETINRVGNTRCWQALSGFLSEIRQREAANTHSAG